MYHRFSYEALARVTKAEVFQHDAVIEGGIGNNVARYLYFRDHGYTGLYVGVDPDPKSMTSPDGLIREYADCFELDRLQHLCSRYGIANPIFVTNSALYLLIAGYENRIADAAKALTRVFRKQLHIRPAGNLPLTASRLFHSEATNCGEFNRIRRFLEESLKRGWNQSAPGKNLLLLKRNEGVYNI